MNWKDHAFRRRVNVQAINPTTIKQMEGRILRNIRYFCSQLIDCKDNGKDVTPGDNWSNARDMTKNVGYLVSDIMGDVIFGRRWETMRRPENRDLITKLPEAVAGIHLVNSPSLQQVAHRLHVRIFKSKFLIYYQWFQTGYMPSLLRLNLDRLLFRRIILGVDRFTSLSKEMFEWRFAQGPQDDLFNALLTAKDAESGASLTTAELVSEAGLLIIAGSDTTKTAITATLFYLLHSPTTLQRLQDEIRTTFATIDDIRIGGQLSGCLFLYACIDETMRLTPSIGSTLMREVRAGGLVVDGEWFPPGTDIGVPHYALHHNEAYFSDPFAFRPERWLSVSMSSNGANAKLEQEQEPSAASASSPAFTPFGVGRTSCIGRYLAYQEISLVIAYMLWQFDMRLQPGSTLGEGRKELGPGRHRKNEFQTLDRFISMHDGPMVEFRQRKDVTG